MQKEMRGVFGGSMVGKTCITIGLRILIIDGKLEKYLKLLNKELDFFNNVGLAGQMGGLDMTKKELTAVGKWTLKYPKGHGHSFFSDQEIDAAFPAACRLAEDKKCLKFG